MTLKELKRIDQLRELCGKILGSDPCCPVGRLKSQSFSFKQHPKKTLKRKQQVNWNFPFKEKNAN